MVEPAAQQGAPPVSFQRIVPVRAYEGVVSQIEQAIFAGDLSPGDRLPSERSLMAQFEVSRGTIREALRVLESNGFIRSRPGDPGGGAEILGNSSGRLSKALTTFATLGQVSLVELIQFRMVVEGSAVRLAAELHTDEELTAMHEAHAEMQRTVGESHEAFSAADVRFHLAVAVCSGNALLGACSEFATSMVLRTTTDHIRQADDAQALMEDTLRRHGAYLDAITDRDGRRAEALARADLLDYYGPYVGEGQVARLRMLLIDD